MKTFNCLTFLLISLAFCNTTLAQIRDNLQDNSRFVRANDFNLFSGLPVDQISTGNIVVEYIGEKISAIYVGVKKRKLSASALRNRIPYHFHICNDIYVFTRMDTGFSNGQKHVNDSIVIIDSFIIKKQNIYAQNGELINGRFAIYQVQGNSMIGSSFSYSEGEAYLNSIVPSDFSEPFEAKQYYRPYANVTPKKLKLKVKENSIYLNGKPLFLWVATSFFSLPDGEVVSESGKQTK